MKKSVSFGLCHFCNERISNAAMTKHLAACSPGHDSRSGKAEMLFHLRVEDVGMADFWFDLEIKGDASLRDMDQMLRKTWLECCGHMSVFRIGSLNFMSMIVGDEFDSDQDERDMSVQISEVLTSGQRFRYEYDFGSTTELALRVLDVRTGTIGRVKARLLARNEPTVRECATCGGPATVICSFCIGDGDPFSCKEHVPDHACGEKDGFLPVVNSPRMGVCDYRG